MQAVRRGSRVRRLPPPGLLLPAPRLLLTLPGFDPLALERCLLPPRLGDLARPLLALPAGLFLAAFQLRLLPSGLGLALLIALPVLGRLPALTLQFLPAAEFLLLTAHPFRIFKPDVFASSRAGIANRA